MAEFITYKHSFNAGDLLTVLPGIQHLYRQTGQKAIIYQRLDLPADYGHNNPHPVQSDGRQVCMNREMFEMCKPLLEAQEYVERFEIWRGEKVDIDYDLTRQHSQMPLPGGSIHHWPSLIYPQLECDLTELWINVGVPQRPLAWEIELAAINPTITIEDAIRIFQQTGTILYKSHEIRKCHYSHCFNKIIINRTERYQNPYIDFNFLKQYADILVFVGTPQEYNIFCQQWSIEPAYLHVENFLELGWALSVCKFFVGNQSFCWHLADGMKILRILEVCTQYPNTFPTGANGHSFVTQNALEYQFNQLIKDTNA